MHVLSLQALLIAIVILFIVLVAHLIEIKHFKYIHESSLSIIFGIFSGLLMTLFTTSQIQFSDEVFFNLMLPPIIFAAGYNLRRREFFENFKIIIYLGVFGTLITFTVISVFSIILNTANLKVSEILMLAAVMSSTDTVAAMSLIKQQKFPRLNSILFGEGIINDAVSILLFRAIQTFTQNQDFILSWQTALIFSLDFLYLLAVSIIIGVATAMAICLLFKNCDSLKNYPVKETCLVLLTGYISFLTSEIFLFSGIISLFSYSLILGYYGFFNLSQEAQKGTSLTLDSAAYLAEAFVFIYLGITLVSADTREFNFIFIAEIGFSMLIARFLAVFLLPCLVFTFKRQMIFSLADIKIIWYSGLVRGVIAFALAYQIDTPNRSLLIGTVLAIVLFTIFILGTLMNLFSDYIGLKPDAEESFIDDYKRYIGENKEISSYEDIRKPNSRVMQLSFLKKKERENMNPLKKSFLKFEQKVIQPIFIKNENPEDENQIPELTKK